MNTKTTLPELLRWRMTQAETDAPPAPTARRLLESLRPWWKTYPEKFDAFTHRLGAVQIAYGHAMVERGAIAAGHAVPALVVEADTESEVALQVLYLELTGPTLHLRFEPEKAPGQLGLRYEATFLAEDSLQPLFTAEALRSSTGEYWLDATLPDPLGSDWSRLRVTDPMPFRVILRARPTRE